MELYEIIDLEYQLYRDGKSDPVKVRKRDRKIGLEYSGPKKDRKNLFRYWLHNLDDENKYPGKSLVSGLTFLRYSVFFFFLISGVITCTAVLAYDGSRPVNIINFLAVFVGLQVFLYLLFFLNILPGNFLKKIPFLGDFYRFAKFIFSWIILKISNQFFTDKTESIRKITNIYNNARSRHNIYQIIEQWILFSITQLGGFAFSLGALFSCAYLVIFSDLAFAWNTTLDIMPGSFHKIVTIISTPWAIFLENTVPSIELVESTRYFRLDGDYSGVQSSALKVGGWWPFLINALLFYGLIPRFIFLTVARFILYRMQRRVPFLSAEYDSLYRRLTSPIYSSQTRVLQNREERSGNNSLRSNSELPINAEACYLILWGETGILDEKTLELIQSRFQWKILETFTSGGLENDQDKLTLNQFKQNPDGAPILVIAESWEAPSKAVTYFLKCLRANINNKRTIVIGLINRNTDNELIPPDMSDWRNWQDASAKLNDPFTCIEPVTEV